MGRGIFVVRFRVRDAAGELATRRVVVSRGARRFTRRGAVERSTRCGVLRFVRLSRPVFTRRALVTYALRRGARVSAVVTRGGRVVRRVKVRSRTAGVHRIRISGRTLRRGDHRVVLRVGGKRYAVVARRL